MAVTGVAQKKSFATTIRSAFARTRPETKAYLQISPGLLLVAGALLVPLLLLILASFWSSQSGGEIDTALSLSNYQRFFDQPGYARILFRSIGIAASVTAITLVLAYPMAYFVAFDVRKHKLIWLILITLPFWTSYLLRVFSWKVILGWNGVINSGLTSIGVIDEPFGFLLYSRLSIVLTMSHAWATFAILPIYLSLEKIDRNLFDAAADLGDGPVKRFFRITLPLSMPGVLAAAVIIFIPTVGDYITPAMVGGPDGMMVSNLIQAQFSKANDWPFGAAVSVVSITSVAMLSFIVVTFIRSMTARIR